MSIKSVDSRAVGRRDTTQSQPHIARSLVATVAEYLFVLLPLVVLSFVVLHSQIAHHSLVLTPEWSFGAAILFGQTIQKISAASAFSRAYPWERTMLLVSALLIFGLAPALISLAMIIATESPRLLLGWSQIILFLAGSIVFLLFGTLSHHLLFRDRDN